MPVPEASASVTAVHRGSSLAVSWEASAGASVLYTDAVSWRLAKQSHAGTSLTIEGVDAAKTYIVGVRAGNTIGDWSSWVNSGATSAAALAVADASAEEPAAGFEAEAAWGLDALRGLMTPYTGVALTADAEKWRAGARLKSGADTEVSLEASLTESAGWRKPESGVYLSGSKRW